MGVPIGGEPHRVAIIDKSAVGKRGHKVFAREPLLVLERLSRCCGGQASCRSKPLPAGFPSLRRKLNNITPDAIRLFKEGAPRLSSLAEEGRTVNGSRPRGMGFVCHQRY